MARDNMRRIDDGVLLRTGNPDALPQIRFERELEEKMSERRLDRDLDAIETDLRHARDVRGRPLGRVTRRVFERSGVPLADFERRARMHRELDALARQLEDTPGPPELGDVEPRDLGLPDARGGTRRDRR